MNGKPLPRRGKAGFFWGSQRAGLWPFQKTAVRIPYSGGVFHATG